MLTPIFRLEQDSEFVYFKIQAPYTNVRDTEVDVDERNFIFSSEPYFLRLKLPGPITEDESSSGKYECDTGEFLFRFRKLNKDENFAGLDMVTSLLAPRDIPDLSQDLIEVLEGAESRVEDSQSGHTSAANVHSLFGRFPYGFANRTFCDFDLGYEFPNIFELKSPNEVSIEERKELRRIHENHKFSDDHYLADMFEGELIQPLLDAQIRRYDRYFEEGKFVEEEMFILKELPNKEYLLTKEEQNTVLFGIADILYAYCYDRRSTLDETSVESSWTINKLSATLSWFEIFTDAQEVITTCYRRSLVYPMYRNFELSQKVHEDLVYLLEKGRLVIVKCLIDIFQIMNTSRDARYILNQLYIKDFLIFAQKCDEKALQDLSDAIALAEVRKSQLDLDLKDLETAAVMVYEEEVVENGLAAGVENMRLSPTGRAVRNGDSDDSDSSSSSSESSDSSSSSDDSSSELDSDDDEPVENRQLS